MKTFLLFLLLFFSVCVSAKKYEGYIITKNKDSIPCKIALNDFRTNFLKTELICAFSYTYIVAGKRKVFRANEIFAFGIKAKGYWRKYYAVTYGKKKTKFMRIASSGSVRLFYCLNQYRNGPILDFYIFQDKLLNGVATFSQSAFPRNFIYSYIKNCPEAKAKFNEGKFSMRKHYEYIELTKLLNTKCPEIVFKPSRN